MCDLVALCDLVAFYTRASGGIPSERDVGLFPSPSPSVALPAQVRTLNTLALSPAGVEKTGGGGVHVGSIPL